MVTDEGRQGLRIMPTGAISTGLLGATDLIDDQTPTLTLGPGAVLLGGLARAVDRAPLAALEGILLASHSGT